MASIQLVFIVSNNNNTVYAVHSPTNDDIELPRPQVPPSFWRTWEKNLHDKKNGWTSVILNVLVGKKKRKTGCTAYRSDLLCLNYRCTKRGDLQMRQ